MNRAALVAISSLLFAGVLLTGNRPLNSQDFSPQPSLYANSGSSPRVFITDSQSWSVSGGFGGSSSGFGGGMSGGARPQTAEIIKTFGDRCKSVTVTLNQESADFVVLLDHEGGKGLARRDNKIAVFNRAGDAIYSDSTRSLGNSVKGACKAIMASPVVAAPAPPPPPAAVAVPVYPTPVAPSQARTPNPAAPPDPPAPPAMAPADPATCSVFVKSTPNGADITIDGKFVGSTPSNLKLSAGDHKINVGMSGYRAWERTITVMAGGSVTLDAKLQKD
jgi:PEGA domain